MLYYFLSDAEVDKKEREEEGVEGRKEKRIEKGRKGRREGRRKRQKDCWVKKKIYA